MLAAALLHPFQRCWGVELLPGLHAAAQRLKAAYVRSGGSVDLEFVCGSFLECDWPAASFLFVNAACFNKALRQRLVYKMRSPALICSVTYPLPGVQVVATLERSMSWGSATLFLQLL